MQPRLLPARPQRWDPYSNGRDSLCEWWAADDYGTSRVTDDGGPLISSWLGRINGINLAAASTARFSWGAVAFNSAYPGMIFNGVANCGVFTSFAQLPTGAVPGEIWIVVQSDLASSNAAVGYLFRYGGSNAAQDRGLFRSRSSSLSAVFATDGTTTLSWPPGTTLFEGAHIVRAYWTGTTEGLVVDEQAAVTAVIASLATGTTRGRAGANNSSSASSFFVGEISDILIFRNILSATQVAKTAGYLAWKSGLQGILPTGHRYKLERP